MVVSSKTLEDQQTILHFLAVMVVVEAWESVLFTFLLVGYRINHVNGMKPIKECFSISNKFKSLV